MCKYVFSCLEICYFVAAKQITGGTPEMFNQQFLFINANICDIAIRLKIDNDRTRVFLKIATSS